MHESRIPGWKTLIKDLIPFYKANVWYLVAVPIVTSIIAVLPLAGVLVLYAIIAFVAVAASGSEVAGIVVNVAFGLVGIAALCWMVIAIGAAQIAAVRASFEGNSVPLSKLVRESFDVKRALNVFGGLFVYGILIMIGLVFFVVPGVYLIVRGTYVPFVLAHENLGITDAIRRSWALTRGYWWATALRFGWFALAATAGSALIALLFSIPALTSVRSVVDFGWQLLVVSPFAIVFCRHMYEQARDRKAQDAEAFHPLTRSEKWQVAGAVVLFLLLGSVQSALMPKETQADVEDFQDFFQKIDLE